jgi:hypothetical protein
MCFITCKMTEITFRIKKIFKIMTDHIYIRALFKKTCLILLFIGFCNSGLHVFIVHQF